MRITFVLASAFSLAGGDRVIASLAKELHTRGHTVTLVSRSRRAQSWRARWRARKQAQHGDAAEIKSHFDGLAMPRRVLERFRPVTNADVPDADIVVATWWETAEWVATLAASKGVKAYLIQHLETFDYLPRARVAATYRLPLHKIVTAQWLLELMQTEYGDTCVSKISTGIDHSLFQAPPRGKQGLPTIGFMYSTVPWKGAAVVSQALASVKRILPSVRVRAFGLDTPSADLPLPPGTDYVCRPEQEQLPSIYAACDVWVCGSWSEGFTLPPMEAMACRCPVVSTRVGGPDEIVHDGINGYLVEPGDSAALAERIVRVLALDEARWRAMSEAAFSTSADYAWDKATDEFEAAFCRAVERTRRGEIQT
jgi:glycosyltransferase involved in cell wall biosynthesis